MDIAASIVTLALEVNRKALSRSGLSLKGFIILKILVLNREGDLNLLFLRLITWRETQFFNNLFISGLEKGISTHLLIAIITIYTKSIRS